MFGLFDPPHVKIAKHLPSDTRTAQAAIEAYADIQLVGLTGNSKDYALGIILSVWAFNSAATGAFHLSERDLTYIRNLGGNCARFLGDDNLPIATSVIDDLIEKGMIPKPE
jgi:hypothetical protein